MVMVHRSLYGGFQLLGIGPLLGNHEEISSDDLTVLGLIGEEGTGTKSRKRQRVNLTS